MADVRDTRLAKLSAIIRPASTAIVRDWSFMPSAPSWRTRTRRIVAHLTRKASPEYRTIRPPSPASRWNCLFLFAPSGKMDQDQRAILTRLRELPGRLLVVVAADRVSAEIDRLADALILKETGGYDFSAYALALDAVARHSPGAMAYVQNDSVVGPFATIEEQLARMPWDLGGFIGTASVENHLSSFAFVLRDVTPARVASLAPALSTKVAYDRYQDVIAMQETRLARIAARHMSVGASWFAPDRPVPPPLPTRLRMIIGRPPADLPLDLSADPAVALPLALMDQGFPFMKRSLFGKFAGVADQDALRDRLAREGWSIASETRR